MRVEHFLFYIQGNKHGFWVMLVHSKGILYPASLLLTVLRR